MVCFPLSLHAVLLAASLVGALRLVMAIVLLGCIGLVAAWYRQQRKKTPPTEVAADPAPEAAPLKVYSVENVLGTTGTKYGQQLKLTLDKLETALKEHPPLSLPTAPPEVAADPAPEASAPPADAPAPQQPTAESAPAATPEAAAATPAASDAAAPTAAQPAGSGDQEIKDFSQHVSSPPELRVAPTKRFSSRKAVVNPEALATLQKTRTTTFIPTHTGQHIPMLEQQGKD
ncbi:hypothetical protein KLP40_14560 [Hymenobacter sp. NST-14]|uniref:hypothetical protein n=1 Tax=Hymenobacter piscis TaxID=2839984 RepID=UPI001C022A5B|nr:hypothetical protein [Hymenobacter piscis]MBT9394390.1 hypothetical protein [Hymenobacter piscis]